MCFIRKKAVSTREAMPTAVLFCLLTFLLLLLPGVLLLELLDPAFGVHYLLPPREEGVAVGAYIDVDFLLRGPRGEGLPARADHLCFLVIRMNAFLHCVVLRDDFNYILYLSRRKSSSFEGKGLGEQGPEKKEDFSET
jgi:hypothetical protein